MPQLALVLDPSDSAAFPPPSPAANDAALPSEGEALDAYSQTVIHVADTVGPTVVSVARRAARGPAGVGSGVAFAPDGYILTNAHVVTGADELEVGFLDGTTSQARVVGVDPPTDLAVLRATAATPRHASFGHSAKLRV